MTKLLAEWFWVDRWEGSSAMLLPMDARGIYREMLSQAWRRGARLPNDELAIQRAIRCTTEEWERSWPLVRPYWRQDGDSLVNDTQLEIYAEAVERSERARQAGLASGRARRRTSSRTERRTEPGTKRPTERATAEQEGEQHSSPPASQDLPVHRTGGTTPPEELGGESASIDAAGKTAEPGNSPPISDIEAARTEPRTEPATEKGTEAPTEKGTEPRTERERNGEPPSPSLSLEQRSNGKQTYVASPDGDGDQSVFPDTPVGKRKRRDGPSSSEVWELYKRILGRTDRLVLGGKRRRKIHERLAEGRTLADFEAAFRGCAGSDFHVAGHHTDVELICRDEAHFERFMALSRKGPTLSAKSRATRSAIAEFLKGGEDDLEKGPR